jgi:alpha-tubulin suppressor-like RCC1 family protein
MLAVATVLAASLALAGCDNDARAVVILEQSTQTLTASSVQSVNGTYGGGCKDRSGSWSVEVLDGADLDHDELSVVLDDDLCNLTLTSLVADESYAATPPLMLTAAYHATASAFVAGGTTGLHANARLGAEGFTRDFAITILSSNDSTAVGADAIAQRTRKLLWSGDGAYLQGAYDLLSPTQHASAITTWGTLTAGFCAIRTTGSLWCWGPNQEGQVGIGSVVTPQWSPVQIGIDLGWTAITASGYHACALRAGTLWCWGQNAVGQLGRGDTIGPQTSPVQIGSHTTWASVSSDYAHTCAIRASGTLWCWGYNAYGQIGIGSTVNPQPTPVQLGNAAWSSVSADFGHTCGIRTDGTLWCWGWNDFGQVGIGTVAPSQMTPAQVGTETTWTAVSTGGIHACGIRVGGSLWCWGYNGYGQLGIAGLGDETSPVRVGSDSNWATVSAGLYHTCATRSGGSLWCWGLNNQGQVGQGTVDTPKTSPVQVGNLTTWIRVAASLGHTCATRSDGTLWCWGAATAGELAVGNWTLSSSPMRVGDGLRWSKAATGTGHTCATRTDGTLWCWGYNGNGELGIGSTVSTQGGPVQVGSNTTWAGLTANTAHTCATRTDGTLWCWGWNAYGQVGNGGVVTPQTAPVQVAGTTWRTVKAGYSHTCATRVDGTLWCWGNNANGELGIGSTVTQETTPVRVGTDATWNVLSVGALHACATRTNGTLWCWGYNASGEIGIGGAVTQRSPVQVGTDTNWSTVATGLYTTCAIRTNGTLWCWGLNHHGQLGIGNLLSQSTPTQVGSATSWNSAVGAYVHTCATRTDGGLWCWGYNVQGQLGLGHTTTPQMTPTRVSAGTVAGVFSSSAALATFSITND